MFDDGIYRISVCKQARFQASLNYINHPVGFAELKSDGKWYVSINDLDLAQYPDCHKRDIGPFIALGSALSALWEHRFDTVAEISTESLIT